MNDLLQALKQMLWLSLIILAATLSPLLGWAQSPLLEIDVADVTAFPGEQNVVIPIYMSNYSDTVVVFQLWLMMDRPDIAVFQTDSGTVIDTTYWDCVTWDRSVCIDSVLTTAEEEWDFFHVDTNWVLIANLDTTGTLCSGWEYVDARSLSGMGFDLNVAGIADLPGPPVRPGIAPQQGGALLKVLADVFDVPDTMTDPVVNILIASQCFSNPIGECIGEAWVDSVLDTTCFVCTAWAGTDCLDWVEVWPPPPEGCDSMVVEWKIMLDTSGFILNLGSITVLQAICGDCDGDGKVNVADLTCFVSWHFFGGLPPDHWETILDVDGVGGVNIADLTYLVSYLFYGGPALTCW